MWIGWCVVICLVYAGCSRAAVSQPPSRVLQEGQTAQLECQQTDGHLYMYWYRQSARQGLQFLLYFYNQDEQERGNISQRFRARQPEKSHLNLNISSVKPEDSAVYFCASSQDTAIQSHHRFLQEPPPFCHWTHVEQEWSYKGNTEVAELVGRSDPDILQPRSLILQEGQAAHMKCEQRKGHNAMYWYQQKAGQALEPLFVFQANTEVYKGNDLARFEAQQFETKYCKLNISDVKLEDSGVYFCASSQDTALQSHHLFLQKPPPLCH
ncbi:UNVERIFIED_CONTAM: hypothetical protein K2H54_024181, partial [Gekko kuhli]